MSELLPEIQKVIPIAEQIQKLYPKLQSARDKSITLLDQYTVIENDEQRQLLVDDLVFVRDTYGAMEGKRKGVTELMDEAKKLMMQPEKAVSDKIDEKKKLIAVYDQAKIDAKKKVEEEARKKKEREDYKVEMTTQVMKRLSNLVVDRIQQVNDGTGKFFKETTLETYDDRAKMLNSMQVKLKPEAWADCFKIGFMNSLLSMDELTEFIDKLKIEESFEKWNESAMKELAPVLNDWKGRLPKLKEDLLALKNAKDETEKNKLVEQQKQADAAAEKQRQDQLNLFQKEQNLKIEEKQEVEMMGNSFQQQAEVQDVGPVGPVKLIGKFKDDKVWVKALCNMIYQSATNPKFPGIYKRDSKTKEIVMDEHGFPIYNDYAKPYVDFILRYGNVQVDGFEVKEISKTIIRK